MKLGFRPYQVFLVWTKWTGDERGDGYERVICRTPLLPIPEVLDLTAVAKQTGGAGRYRAGSVRLNGISMSYTQELLEGKVVPEKREDEVPEPYEFFYEIVEDGRHGPQPLRGRFVLTSTPFLDVANQQWTLTLDKQSGDMGRDGQPVNDPIQPPEGDPLTRRLVPPDED